MKIRSAKDKGARFETAVADYLAFRLQDERVHRVVKHGAKDQGDVHCWIHDGGPLQGQMVVVECKAVKGESVRGTPTKGQAERWMREAQVERGNADAAMGVVAWKRPGVGMSPKTIGQHLVALTHINAAILGAPIRWSWHGYAWCTLEDFATAIGGER